MSRALCIDIHTYTSPLPAGRIKPAKSQQILLKLRSKVLPIHHERAARTVKVGTSRPDLCSMLTVVKNGSEMPNVPTGQVLELVGPRSAAVPSGGGRHLIQTLSRHPRVAASAAPLRPMARRVARGEIEQQQAGDE